ncbi:Ribitol transporter [Escherichia coli]|nr:Ribitol transporter [Escherichia coli]
MSLTNKQWLGLPLNLVWGYIAIAIFMTGDGFELAFLSHYIKALGFTPAEASFAFTLYGLAAALSAWVSGVVAEIITPQKTMFIGFVLWCIFHVLFLVFGLGQANYALILLFYGIRGLHILSSFTPLSLPLCITCAATVPVPRWAGSGRFTPLVLAFSVVTFPALPFRLSAKWAPCGWRWDFA